MSGIDGAVDTAASAFSQYETGGAGAVIGAALASPSTSSAATGESSSSGSLGSVFGSFTVNTGTGASQTASTSTNSIITDIIVGAAVLFALLLFVRR